MNISFNISLDISFDCRPLPDLSSFFESTYVVGNTHHRILHFRLLDGGLQFCQELSPSVKRSTDRDIDIYILAMK